jgi:hypothetical protein
MKDFITVCVLCFLALMAVDVLWLHGKYLAALMHGAVVAMR